MSSRSKSFFSAYLHDLSKPVYDKGLLWFLLLTAGTIVATYFTNTIIASLWSVLLLVLYYRSDDEPMWLAFFLVTVDGFMGFMGMYSVTLTLFPGLPAIEISQFYVMLTVVKVLSRKSDHPLFYRKYMQILGIYLVFLIFWGLIMGLSSELNMYMRVLKTSIPFLLIYSLPRLMPDLRSYKRFFGIVFIIVLSAFALQLFSLITGIYPAEAFMPAGDEIADDEAFRTFYNAISTLIGLFGALLFLSIKGRTGFNNWFLLLVVFASVMMSVLSATRGWIIAFGLIVILSGLLVRTIDTRKITGLVIISAILILAGSSSATIREQVAYSKERLLKMESIRSGDITAEGTLHRLDVRSPRVMNIWRQSPLFGWGFSDTGFRSSDGHIGNQTLLMFSGLTGFVLLNGFLLWFMYMMYIAFRRSRKGKPYRNGYLVFIIFLIGWFIIHSTSSQQFYFSAVPLRVMPQAVFLGLSAVYYNLSVTPKAKR
ncbi:MAG: oligosaccharide repeat unit polymerase [Bacteroidales bacterium]|nr:oligosaccharide repeat unit polymerase [Bacteroidales bacterium]